MLPIRQRKPSRANALLSFFALCLILAASIGCAAASVGPAATSPATATAAVPPTVTAALPTVAPVAVATATDLPVTAAAEPSTTAAATFVDDAGRKVQVKSNPTKIVSLAPSNTELLFALGLGDRVVGVTTFDDYPAEATAKAKVGGFSDVDKEKVVALAPDIVFASNIHVGKVVPELEKLGLTVVVIDPQTVDDIGARLETIGKLTGKVEEAKALRAQLDKRIADTAAKANNAGKPPRVFWMLGDGLFTAGPGSFVNDLIGKAGGINIAGDAKTQWPELSMEAVVQANPEVIVIPGPDGQKLADKLKADPAWRSIDAVKNGRFVLIADQNIVMRPGPRIADGLDAVAQALHPGRSSDTGD